MRATVTIGIELAQLLKLQKIVEERKFKNISSVVREAIDMYLEKKGGHTHDG